MRIGWWLVGLACTACAPSSGDDTGPDARTDALDEGIVETTPDAEADGPPGLSLTVVYADGECGDLSLAHDAPGFLFRLEVRGRPGAPVQVRARRPLCGVEPFVYEELTLDASGLGTVERAHPGGTDCAEGLLGGWLVLAESGGEISAEQPVVFRNAACGAVATCTAAETWCPPAGADADADADPDADADVEPTDDGGALEVTLLDLPGDVFTPTAAETVRTYDVGENGVVYERVDVAFDFHTVEWQPEVPDEGTTDRTEHILFGLFRDHRPRSDERYLMGAAAVTFDGRSPHFRMFGRIVIGDGWTTYTDSSGSYPWELGRTYHLACSLDGATHVQQCDLSLDGTVVATRTLDVAYLVPEEHLDTAFYVELGLPRPGDIEVSPLDWTFSNLRVTARLR